MNPVDKELTANDLGLISIPGAAVLSGVGVSFRIPKNYKWNPQPDITAYELALTLPYCFGLSAYQLEDFLASHQGCARHWIAE